MGRRLGKYMLSRRRAIQEAPGIELQIGRDLTTNRRVTVKVFDTTITLAAGVGELIKFEVGTMSRTNWHPHVVELLDVLASPRKVFVVMETVSGGDLFEAIAVEGRLEDGVARRYFIQLVDAVQHCHDRGVCHRDIKPENVLLDDRGNVKLSGFALAGITDPTLGNDVTNLLHATCGTPEYTAPEVVQGTGYDGRAADVWSLGVTLYAMLAGFLPFEAETMSKTFEEVQAGEFRYAPEMTESARSLLDGILEVEPTKRYTIAQVRSHPWFRQPPAKREETCSAKSPKNRPAIAHSSSCLRFCKNSWKGGAPGSIDSGGGSSADGGGSCHYGRALSEVGFPMESEEECSEHSAAWAGSPDTEIGLLEYNPGFTGDTLGAMVPLGTIIPEEQDGGAVSAGCNNKNESNVPSADNTIALEEASLHVGSGRGSRASSSPCGSRSSTPRSSWIGPGALRPSRQSRLPLDSSPPSGEDSAACSCPQRTGSGARRLRTPPTPLIITPPRLRHQLSRCYAHRPSADMKCSPLSPPLPTPSTPPPIRQSRPRPAHYNPGLDDTEKAPPDGGEGSAQAAPGTIDDHVGVTVRKYSRACHGSRDAGDAHCRVPALMVDSPKFDRRAWAVRMVRGAAKTSLTIEADLIATAAAAAAAAGVAEPSSPSTPRGIQLLFSVEEPDRIALATRLREALENLGCACRILRQCTATAHVRVKACRTLMTAEPREGNDEPIVGVTFTLAHPGTHHVDHTVGCCEGTCRRGGKGGVNGTPRVGLMEKFNVDSLDSDAATASVTTDASMERCNSVLVGTRSGDGTDILVALCTGAPYDFHSLVQELLVSRAGAEIFAVGNLGHDPRSTSRRMRRIASAASNLRVGTAGRRRDSTTSVQQ